MPYLSISVNKPVPYQDKMCISREAGRDIIIIPGKTEYGLMVKIDDESFMTLGSEDVPCAFIDLRLYKHSLPSDKKSFAEMFIKRVAPMLDVPEYNIYMNIIELDEWGSEGTYHLGGDMVQAEA